MSGEDQGSDGSSHRSAFERDFDRIIFSHPFRRLQDKTQVFPLPEQDFVHTRLTHSLEVSSVGRSLGKKVGEVVIQRYQNLQDQDYTQYDFGAIVSAACLCHDLGNPPFGHTGEDALSEYFKSNPAGRFFQTKVTPHQWEDLISFEGNAQGYRLLTGVDHLGLKLSDQTLAAFTKYPRQSLLQASEAGRKSQKKYGYFESEQQNFAQLAQRLGLQTLTDHQAWCRHPLAFLVEAADDICYHIIDLEDGCRLGLVGEDETTELLAQILGDRYQPQKLQALPGSEQRIGLLRALTIGVLIDQCAQVFLDHESEIIAGNFDQALTDLAPSSNVLDEIISLSLNRLYRSSMVLEIEAAGYEVLGGLLDSFAHAAYRVVFEGPTSKKDQTLFRLLPVTVQQYLKKDHVSVYQMLRVILDFISGITDKHAISLFRKLRGISLPGSAAK